MFMRLRSSGAAALAALLCACSGAVIPSATPAKDLPDLIVPTEIANGKQRKDEPPRLAAIPEPRGPDDTSEYATQPEPEDAPVAQRPPLPMTGDRSGTPGWSRPRRSRPATR